MMFFKLMGDLRQSDVGTILLNKIYRFLTIVTGLSLGLASYAYLEKQEADRGQVIYNTPYYSPQKQLVSHYGY